MAERAPRWPTLEQTIENAKQGVIDDREAAVPPYDLEDWEILEQPERGMQPSASRRRRTRKAQQTKVL